MSDASKRGKTLEEDIARILRSKLKVRVYRGSKSGAGPTTRNDVKDWYCEQRLGLEVKN